MPTLTDMNNTRLRARQSLIDAWFSVRNIEELNVLAASLDRFGIPRSVWLQAYIRTGHPHASAVRLQAECAAAYALSDIRLLKKLLRDPSWKVRRSNTTLHTLRDAWLGSVNNYSTQHSITRGRARQERRIRFGQWLANIGAIDSFVNCDACGAFLPIRETDQTPIWSHLAILEDGRHGRICVACANIPGVFLFGNSAAPEPGWYVHRTRAARPENLIRNYDFDVLEVIDPQAAPYEQNPFYMGVELELAMKARGNGLSEHEYISCAYSLAKLLPHCIFKNDGSIAGSSGWRGFEVVSAPCTLAMHKELWYDAFISPLFEKYHGPSSCGMHVHLDRRWINPLTLAKLVVFFNKPQMYNMLQVVAGRSILASHSHYCPANPQKQGSDIYRVRYETRYASLNLTKGITAEIRIYASTTDYATFMARIEFSHAAVMYCKDASLKAIDPKSVLAWLSKHTDEYPYLWMLCQKKRSSMI